jgi:hypothetical protein
MRKAWAPYPPPPFVVTGVAVFGGEQLAAAFADELIVIRKESDLRNALFFLELAGFTFDGMCTWSRLHNVGTGCPAHRAGAKMVSLLSGLWCGEALAQPERMTRSELVTIHPQIEIATKHDSSWPAASATSLCRQRSAARLDVLGYASWSTVRDPVSHMRMACGIRPCVSDARRESLGQYREREGSLWVAATGLCKTRNFGNPMQQRWIDIAKAFNERFNGELFRAEDLDRSSHPV